MISGKAIRIQMSTAEREVLKSFLRDVWLTWLVADATPANGGRRSGPPRREWGASPLLARTLLEMCKALMAGPGLPNGFRFDAASHTLGFTAEAFHALVAGCSELHDLDGQQTQRLLYEDEGLWKRIVRLLTYWYSDWRDGKIDWSTIAPDALAKRTQQVFHVSFVDVGFPGIFIIGYVDAEHLWGFRSEGDVCHLMESSDDEPRIAIQKLLTYKPRQRAELLQARWASPADAMPSSGRDTATNNGELKDFTILRLQPDREYEALVLQAIHSIEHFGLTPAPEYVVRLVSDTFGIPVQGTEEARARRFNEALFRLHEEDWIEVDLYSDDPYALHVPRANWTIGFLDLIPWVLRNQGALRVRHWQKLLGEKAATTGDTKLLVAIVDAVAPTLSADDERLPMYAEKLAQSAEDTTVVDRAESLLSAFRGARDRMRNAWIAIAAKHLHGGRSRMVLFCNAVAALDDEGLQEFVRRERLDLGTDFQRLSWRALRAPEYLPAVERIAAALNEVWPNEQPRFTNRLAQLIADGAQKQP